MVDKLIKEFKCIVGYLPIVSPNTLLTIFHSTLAPDIRDEVGCYYSLELHSLQRNSYIAERHLQTANCSYHKPLAPRASLDKIGHPTPLALPAPKVSPKGTTTVHHQSEIDHTLPPHPTWLQLTLEEYPQCCTQGLCYHYNEYFAPEHYCVKSLLIHIITD